MNDDIGHISGTISGLGSVNTLTARIFNPEDITGITIDSEVISSPKAPHLHLPAYERCGLSNSPVAPAVVSADKFAP